MPPDNEWDDVEKAVCPTDTLQSHGRSVSGRLSRKAAGLLRNRNVTLIVATDSVEQRNSWMESIRLRVAPWQILHRRFKCVLLSGPLSQNVLRAVCQLVEKNRDEMNATQATGYVEPLHDVTPVTNGVEILSRFVESVAAFVKTCVPFLKNVAESVADVAKYVTVVSSTVTIIVLCATLVEMGMEVRRGEKELPRLQWTIEEMRGDVVKSIVHVLHPDCKVDERFVKDVFETQEKLLDILARVEKQMMRRGAARFWKAGKLTEIEDSVNALKRCVVDVVQSGSIAVNSRSIADNFRTIAANTMKITRLENNAVESDVPPMRYRPKVNSYFVGREEELNLLEHKLNQYGSVSIMQFGGVGKTQLIAAFAAKAEQSGWVPGGSFWIGAHGDRSQIVHSLADFTESLTKRRLRKEDREDADAVLSALRRKLESIVDQWLLCVDNADDSQVNPIVGKVVSLALTAGGWVIVTSRQGGSTLWEGMRSEQKLQLNPLNEKQAMIALYRRKNKCLREDAPDTQIVRQIEQLKTEDGDEFRALEELAGVKTEHGLLALAQAGSYMDRFHISFSQYVAFFAKKRVDSAVMELFRVVEDDGLKEEHQRSIWLTWKIYIDALSDIGRAVLCSFALFDHAPVPMSLVRKLDHSFEANSLEFVKLVQDQLVNGASLIQMNREGTYSMFGMHRLIREYITRETKLDNESWLRSVLRAVRALHECVSDELTLTRHSTKCPPRTSCTPEAKLLLPHVTAVLLNSLQASSLRSGWFVDSSYLVDLFRFSNRTQVFFGRIREAATVCNHRYEVPIETYRGADHCNIAEALKDKGYLASKNGSFNKAGEILHESLEMYSRILGERVDHVDVAEILCELGRVAIGKGKYEEAEKRYEESLAMKRRIHTEGVDYPNVAASLQGLSLVALGKGEYEQAQKRYKESFAIKRSMQRECADQHNVAASLHALGLVALGKGEYQEAQSRYEESLAIERRIYGEGVDHPDVAATIHELGGVALRKGEYEEARKRYEESLDMKRRLHGEGVDHPNKAISLHGLGQVVLRKGDYEEAQKWYDASLAMKRRIHGES